MTTTKELVYVLAKNCPLAVVSTTNEDGKPQAALIGIAVTDTLEIIFDIVKTSRKYRNLAKNSSVALVIGWDNETTVQYEGEAVELGNDDKAEAFRDIYYKTWPDGKERRKTMQGLVHFKISPHWLRYSNFNEPVIIEEIVF